MVLTTIARIKEIDIHKVVFKKCQ